MLDAIVIATSTSPRDEAIVNFCREQEIEIVRGPEENVLARYVLAAAQTNADVVVRVSSDAPFVDPEFVDHLVRSLIVQNGDYVLVEPGAACAHDGVDPFSRRALDKLAREAGEDPVAQEHVSGYFKLHPDFVRIVHAAPDPRLAHEPARLTIDTPDDLDFIETIHQRLAAKAGEASLSDLLLLLDREPRLKAMNAHVRQKGLQSSNGVALIHCDGGGIYGYGHLKRSLTLARALRDTQGFGAVFALNGDDQAAKTVRAAGFEAVVLGGLGKAHALNTMIASSKPNLLIADARSEVLTRANLAKANTSVAVTAVIDDSSDRRLAASYAYYPPVPQAQRLSWKGSSACVRVGWEWALLGFDPTRIASIAPKDEARPTVVVSMGGSDPMDLTRLAACALCKITAPFKARFIIGPGFRNTQRLVREIEAMSPNFETVQGAEDLGSEFARADLALVAFGVTAYELAALGVPALYLAISDDHAVSAQSFSEAGMGIVLGLGRVLRAEEIARAVWEIIVDKDRRYEMSRANLNMVDGRAGERIAADLAAALAGTQPAKGVSAL